MLRHVDGSELRWRRYVQLIAAVFFHLPADIYQTPNVFGVRIIMVPAYALIVIIKGMLCLPRVHSATLSYSIPQQNRSTRS